MSPRSFVHRYAVILLGQQLMSIHHSSGQRSNQGASIARYVGLFGGTLWSLSGLAACRLIRWMPQANTGEESAKAQRTLSSPRPYLPSNPWQSCRQRTPQCQIMSASNRIELCYWLEMMEELRKSERQPTASSYPTKSCRRKKATCPELSDPLYSIASSRYF
jgi:hypothetical protein